MAARPKKAEYVIEVEDRNTGERHKFPITARTVQEAEAKADEAGWRVIDPSAPLPEPTPEEVAAKQQERAVKFGILKALGIAAGALIALVVLGNIVVFLASQ